MCVCFCVSYGEVTAGRVAGYRDSGSKNGLDPPILLAQVTSCLHEQQCAAGVCVCVCIIVVYVDVPDVHPFKSVDQVGL